MSTKKNAIRSFAALVAAIMVVSSSVMLVAAAGSGYVTLDNTTSKVDSNGQVDLSVDYTVGSGASYDHNITAVEGPNGTKVSVSASVAPGGSIKIHTDDGTTDSSNLYSNLTGNTDLPLDGNLTVHYDYNGSSYSQTISYNFDSDGDGIADSNDKYPTDAVRTDILTKSGDDPVEAVYVEYSGNGTADVTVTDSNGKVVLEDTSDISTQSGETILLEYSVPDDSEYTVETHTNATVQSTGLIYDTTSGGGGGGGVSALSNGQLGGLAVLVVGLGLVFLSRKD